MALAPTRDRYYDYVQVLPAFDWWRQTADLVFLRHTGRSSYDLPIPARTWRVWWTSGRWPARTVGEVLGKFVMEMGDTIGAR